MADLHLVVNGRRYGGWKSIRVVRSMEALAGSFELSASDRWAEQDEAWPIAEEDECRVEIDDQPVITGYVDRRSISIDASTRDLRYIGRDRAAALVDCSVVLERWSFRRATVLEIARAVAAPFGIAVSVQPGLEIPERVAKLSVNPGDSAFQVIERAAQSAGLLVVSDGRGGIVLTRGRSTRAAPLVLGQNLKSIGAEYDGMSRFARYVVVTQTAGTDAAYGAATRVRAEATDEGVRRRERVLLVQPESGVTTDYARRRADWEARVRAARAEAVTGVVHGWQQPDGTLWPTNARTYVQARAAGIDGDLLISTVESSLDDQGGPVSILTLVRPDAFTPEPRAAKVKPSTQWKELAGGIG